jgi:hypothetical protein
MNLVGIMNGNSIRFNEKMFPLIFGEIAQLYDFQKDLIGVEKSFLNHCYIELNKVLQNEISKIKNFIPPDSIKLKYEELFFETLQKRIFVNRFNSKEMELPWMDNLVCIFNRAVVDECVWYSYYIPTDIYSQFYPIAYNINNRSLIIRPQEIERNLLNHLIDNSLIYIVDDRIELSTKMLLFC